MSRSRRQQCQLHQWWQRARRFATLACLATCLALAGEQLLAGIPTSNSNLRGPAVRAQAVPGQSLRAESVAAAIYQRLPDLPKENQYVRRESGEVDESFTLLERFIRYHQDLKKRSTRFRLDWKLTLADYLGVNEPLNADRYPGNSTLETNPLVGDTAAIRQLNRRQRAELVALLVSFYAPAQEPSPTPTVSPQSQPPASEAVPPTQPSLSQPGDAQLLMP